MMKKPWTLVLFALLHWCEPVAKVVFYSLLWKVTPDQVLSQMLSDSGMWDKFLFWASFPLAGVAIYLVKPWSLPVFLGIQGVTLFNHYSNWHESPSSFPLPIFVGLSLLNTAVATYLLLPSVRVLFLNVKMRWWETPPRFVVNWKVSVTQGKKEWEATVANLSRGGVLLQSSRTTVLQESEVLTVTLHFQNSTLSLKGRVVHRRINERSLMSGVQFEKMSPEEQKELRRWLKALVVLGVQQYPVPANPIAEMGKDMGQFLKTGKGFFPESNANKKAGGK